MRELKGMREAFCGRRAENGLYVWEAMHMAI